jgi:hypothetical protein
MKLMTPKQYWRDRIANRGLRRPVFEYEANPWWVLMSARDRRRYRNKRLITHRQQRIQIRQQRRIEREARQRVTQAVKTAKGK